MLRAGFTAGLRLLERSAASEAATTFRNDSTLQKVCVGKTGKTLCMFANDLDELLGLDLEEEAPPRFLPKYDPYLMGHKDRTRITGPEHLQQVYCPMVGEVAATILINGRIAATWTARKTKKTLTISVRPNEMTKNGAKEVQQEAEHLGSFMGIEHVDIEVSR